MANHSNILASVAAAKSLQSCQTLCNTTDGSPPGSTIPEIVQARTVEWVAISFSNAWKWKSESEVAQLCPTLCDPMNCSLGCNPIGLLHPWNFPGKSTGVGCHCLLRFLPLEPHEQHEKAKRLWNRKISLPGQKVSNKVLGRSREKAPERMKRLGQNGNDT